MLLMTTVCLVVDYEIKFYIAQKLLITHLSVIISFESLNFEVGNVQSYAYDIVEN